MLVFFRVVSFNGPQRFTSDSLYTSLENFPNQKTEMISKIHEGNNET